MAQRQPHRANVRIDVESYPNLKLLSWSLATPRIFKMGKRISLPVGAESMPAVEVGIALLRWTRDLVGEKPPVRDQPLRERIQRDVHELANRLRTGIQDTGDGGVADEHAQRGPGRGQLRPADPLRIHPVDLEPELRHGPIRYRPATRRRQADIPCTTRSRGSPTIPRRRCRALRWTSGGRHVGPAVARRPRDAPAAPGGHQPHPRRAVGTVRPHHHDAAVRHLADIHLVEAAENVGHVAANAMPLGDTGEP